MGELGGEMRQRVEQLLGAAIVSAVPVARGYTAAGRWRVELASGDRVFLKYGTTKQTADALRLEHRVYEQLRGDFMPTLLAWEEHAQQPFIALEDLGDAYWPPPWRGELVEQVQETLTALHACRAPLEPLAELAAELGDGWLQVAADPEPFLRLGLVTSSWLQGALPQLIAASAEAQTQGNEVIHLDVRSDNLCQTSRGVVLIDWNWARLGDGALDTGFWLPSLQAEGGPAPESLLPGCPEIAAFVSGFFAARAGLPLIPDAPSVRVVQRQQLAPALSWATRALAL